MSAENPDGTDELWESRRALFSCLAPSQAGDVVLARLTRPTRRNALSQQSLDELLSLLDMVEADPGTRAVVIAGDENAFSSGQDVKEPEAPNYIPSFNRLMDRLESFPKPVVAAIAGWCIAGGLELALCCDMRVAAESAKLGDFHARVNSIGGGGVIARLPRLVGTAVARRLIYTGELIAPHDALRAGLIDELHPSGAEVAAAIGLARRMVCAEAETFSMAKRALRECAQLALPDAVRHSIDLQNQLQSTLAEKGKSMLANLRVPASGPVASPPGVEA